jgi:hypothetical protein
MAFIGGCAALASPLALGLKMAWVHGPTGAVALGLDSPLLVLHWPLCWGAFAAIGPTLAPCLECAEHHFPWWLYGAGFPFGARF